MRVISGSARGRKLIAPEGLETRPTTDRIKESLFNIIAMDLYDCAFLDLFSGSGGIGIEALSRGAKKAVFVEKSAKAAAVIEENIKAARVDDRATLLKTDVLAAINMLKNKNEKFNIIFLDPPYSAGLYESVLDAICKTGILNEDGYIICEHDMANELPNVDGLKCYRIKEFGKTTKMSFWTWEEEND